MADESSSRVHINRTTQPYRIYKPLFLDDNDMHKDLDREFESISQALIWVTNAIDTIVKAVNPILPEGGKIKLEYPSKR